MIQVITDLPELPSTIKYLIKSVAKKSLAKLNIASDTDLTILIGDNDLLHSLNLQYRGVDRSTDVLSFESDMITPETGRQYLGDIAISYPEALRHSIEESHSIEDEISLLVIHGILHLLGYDHGSENQKKIMWETQENVLSEFGIPMKEFNLE